MPRHATPTKNKLQRMRRLAKVLVGSMFAVIFVITLGGSMGLLTGKRPGSSEIGVADARLKPVRTDRSNAVSSFATTPYHQIAPLNTGDDPRAAFEALVQVVNASPRTQIIDKQPGYLYAEFTSRVLRFVDDVEFLLDEPGRVIHVRSASRLGRLDFGVNRERIETIRTELAARIGSGPKTPQQGASKMSQQTTASGLIIEDVTVGSGDEAKAGQRVRVHYTGWLYKDGQVGAKFDSSKDRNDPFVFPLGAGHVIRGWDEGVAGMRVGGSRKLIIPPELGYGARGAGGVIPPNATLLFEVDLLGL